MAGELTNKPKSVIRPTFNPCSLFKVSVYHISIPFCISSTCLFRRSFVTDSLSKTSTGCFLHTFASDTIENRCKITRFVFVRLVILP